MFKVISRYSIYRFKCLLRVAFNNNVPDSHFIITFAYPSEKWTSQPESSDCHMNSKQYSITGIVFSSTISKYRNCDILLCLGHPGIIFAQWEITQMGQRVKCMSNTTIIYNFLITHKRYITNGHSNKNQLRMTTSIAKYLIRDIRRNK